MRFGPIMTVLAGLKATSITVSNDVMTDSLIAAVNGVHHSCRVNTDMINHYNGGALPTTEINRKTVFLTFASIHGAQMKILTDAVMTPVLTVENTARAVEVVLDTLQYSVPDTVVAMMNKKAEFEAAGLIDVVRNSLNLLLHNHEEGGAAIGPKVDHSNATMNDLLEKEVKDVTGKLIEGIEFFSKC